MKNSDMPAMPCGESYKTQQSYGGDWVECKKGALYSGLTKREEFTKVAMQQLIPKYMHLPATDRWQLVANEAINCAEAVLAELERRKPKC